MRRVLRPRPISNGMEPAANNASTKIITALVIGLLVGFVAGVFWQARRSEGVRIDTSAQAVKTETKGETAAAVKGTTVTMEDKAGMTGMPRKALSVIDQPAGDKVEIASLDAKEILWVAVREEKDGKIGNILGAQKVQEGSGQTVTVELLRPTVAGGIYHVVLYRDVGDPAFNYREDVAIDGAGGTFKAK